MGETMSTNSLILIVPVVPFGPAVPLIPVLTELTLYCTLKLDTFCVAIWHSLRSPGWLR